MLLPVLRSVLIWIMSFVKFIYTYLLPYVKPNCSLAQRTQPSVTHKQLTPLPHAFYTTHNLSQDLVNRAIIVNNNRLFKHPITFIISHHKITVTIATDILDPSDKQHRNILNGSRYKRDLYLLIIIIFA